MNNTYLSEAITKLPGIRLAQQLAKLIQGKGYVETLAPMGTSKKMLELYEYRITCYHPDMEKQIKDKINKPDLKFKIIRR